MHRGTPRDTGFRGFHGSARATVNVADDDRLMQELDADIMHSDNRSKIERPQNYGFTSVLLKRDESQQQQGGGQGQSGIGVKGPAAEAVMVFPGGNRSHPVAVVVDDRRHRPRGLKPGESAQYDDQGQMTYIARDGNYVISNKEMASLRHANKQKQGKGSGSYDHKGGNPNTEVRVTAGSVFVYVDNVCMVEVVKASKKVYLGGKSDDPMSKVMTEDGPSVNVYAKIE